MSDSSYIVTNETRGYLEQFVEDLIDIAAQGNAPDATTIVEVIEGILEDQYYIAATRDEDGRVVTGG